jgi:hypothetical protein
VSAGPRPQNPSEDSEPPPILGTWRNLYALVLGVLIVVIALLWALTRAYS